MAKKMIAIAALFIVLVLIGSTALVARLGRLAETSPPATGDLASARSRPVDGRLTGAAGPAASLSLRGTPDALRAGHRAKPDAATGWTISGRVVRIGEPRGAEVGASWVDETRPAAGAVAVLKPHPRKTSEGEVPPISRRVCGRDGEFKFTGVPGGVYLRLDIDDPSSEYRALSFRFEEPTEDSHQKELGDILVGPGGALTVELRGPTEEPVAGGSVLVHRATSSTEPNLTAAGLSDSRREAIERGAGIYILPRAYLGPLKIRARAPGHSPADPVELAAFPDGPVVIPLAAGNVIAGRVRSTEGQPIEGALVTAVVASEDPWRARSDASGRFVLDDLGAQKHTLTVSAEGFVSLSTESTPGVEELEFELSPEGLLAGRVEDDDGNPIARARLILLPSTPGAQPKTATAGSRGAFTFRNLLEDSYLIVADRAGFAPALAGTIEVRPGERVTDQIIRLGPGFPASGKVVEARTHRPIAGARVDIHLAGDGVDTIKRSASSDDSGAFALDDLGEGSWIVSAQANGHLPLERPIELAAGETPDLTLTLEEGNDAALTLWSGVRANQELLAFNQIENVYRVKLTAADALGQEAPLAVEMLDYQGAILDNQKALENKALIEWTRAIGQPAADAANAPDQK